MEPIFKKNCIIGEGPVWCERNKRLYFVNPVKANEICSVNADGSEPKERRLPVAVTALGFTKDGGLIISSFEGGVFLFDEETGERKQLADIIGCNDAKVGPDGCFYVGTQSSKRLGKSDEIDGKLYRIDKSGNVTVLLDGLILSNGLDWSADEKRFYHTDSDTNYIKEYNYDSEHGSISYTGRACYVPGVDGFAIDERGIIYAACWGREHIALVDTEKMEVVGYIDTPVPIPTSCCFFGEEIDMLAVTTANFDDTARENPESGYTFREKMSTKGKKPYLFG